MISSFAKRAVLATLALLLGTVALCAQTMLVNEVQVNDPTTGKSSKLSKPAGVSTEQTINFPSSAGTAGQVLSISSISGNTITLGWSTESVSTASLSRRVATTMTSSPSGTPNGLEVAIGGNKKYRIAGLIKCGRVDSAATKSDGIVFKITGPTNTAFVSISVLCYNCPDAPNVRTHQSAYADNATTNALDPSSASADYNVYAYAVEGIVHTGSTSGNVTISVDDNGSGSNDVKVGSESYVILTEIN